MIEGNNIKLGGVNYSLEEQLIGTWIDGKPLYQKMIYVENLEIAYSDDRYDCIHIPFDTINFNIHVIDEIDVTIHTNYDTIKMFGGRISSAHLNASIPNTILVYIQSYNNSRISNDPNIIKYDVRFTVKYTKSTD